MKKNATWKVYKYTNKQNEMCYIGVTSQTLKERAGKEGRGYKRKDGGKFWEAIQEFGWNEFDSEILEDNITDRKVAIDTEVKYIKEFNSTENGYNEIDTTQGNKDKTWKWSISEERKEELKLENSKQVICGGVIYTGVDELSRKCGISKGTLYGWMVRDKEFVNYSEQREYYLKDLGLKYYEELTDKEEKENKLLYENKILSNDIQIQEKRILINKELIKIYCQLGELINFESNDNTITNGQKSNYFYLKNIINNILNIKEI